MKNRNLEHSDHWATPDKFYKKLDKEFHFDFDPCPLRSHFDGLQIEWGNCNFVNPPYSQKLKEDFIRKGIEQAQKGKKSVFLIPVSTSTKIFHEVILPNAHEIRFVKGRISFIGVNTKGEISTKNKGMHDSMIVVFTPESVKNDNQLKLFK